MYGDQAVSEQALAKDLMGRLPTACVVLGDRNFGVFSVAYHADQRAHPGVFRLTKARVRRLHGGTCPIAGTDKIICWNPSHDDLRTNPEISRSASLQGRLLAVRPQGAKKLKLFLFTTLDLASEKILELYAYRWQIETDLRWLKREVRLHVIEAESRAMVEKELVLAMAAYNLTRASMNEAAVALGIPPRQISYSLAQNTINAFLPYLANARTEAEQSAILDEMLRVFAYCKLPRRRKRRCSPRAVWPRTCPFPTRKTAQPRQTR
jgi:hypothetical protein